MQAASRKYGLNVHRHTDRTYVGLAELRQLIDYDMMSTPSIEVAEGHHLAWCLGRVCSVRPGSIGPSKNSDKLKTGMYLTWRDLTFTRGAKEGEFRVDIVFRSLKTNFEDPASAPSNKSPQSRQLKCVVMSPQSIENLLFSIPHRLLVIALRRGILDGIENLDQLFESDLQHIQVCLMLIVSYSAHRSRSNLKISMMLWFSPLPHEVFILDQNLVQAKT